MTEQDNFYDYEGVAKKTNLLLVIPILTLAVCYLLSYAALNLTGVEGSIYRFSGTTLAMVAFAAVFIVYARGLLHGSVKSVIYSLSLIIFCIVLVHAIAEFIIFYSGLKLYSEYPNVVCLILYEVALIRAVTKIKKL